MTVGDSKRRAAPLIPCDCWVLVACGLALLGALALFADQSHAQPFGQPSVLQAKPLWSKTAARPGDKLALALVIDLHPGWHINADNAQINRDSDFVPQPTHLSAPEPAAGLAFETVQYPPAHDFSIQGFDSPVRVFDGRSVLLMPVTVDEAAPLGAAVSQFVLSYQACNDTTCLMPQRLNIRGELPIVGIDQPVADANQPLFANLSGAGDELQAEQPQTSENLSQVDFDAFFLGSFSLSATGWGLVVVVLLASLGGLLLNFTPCVLPVIPIKIMGLSRAAGSRGRCLALGLAMAGGVVGFWLGLGGIVSATTGAALRGLAGGMTATGQLFQYPWFTISVGVMIAAMAVGMCGLFALRLPQLVYRLQPQQETLIGSFAFGIMTAVLSTPCTAPFMGSAAAWASGQKTSVAMLVFAAIGLGMALPYLILSANPALVDKMPRTGPASELIKQAMGLLMLAAAAYFISVGMVSIWHDGTASPSQSYWWVVAAFVIAAGAWVIWRTLRLAAAPVPRVVFISLGAAMIVGAVFMANGLTARPAIQWVYYTQQRFADALDGGQVVVMDFTAEWCLNCKALEHTVLNNQRVVNAVAQGDIAAIKVDLTNPRNGEANRMLREVGRVSIPLLVVFAPDGSQVFASHGYTITQVLDAIAEARSTARQSPIEGIERGMSRRRSMQVETLSTHH